MRMMMMMGWVAVAVAASVGALALLHAMVAQEVPQPYMDEQFHCKQAMHYCKGEFYVWDPMITTFPGTYLHSTGVIYVLSSVLSWMADLLRHYAPPELDIPTSLTTSASSLRLDLCSPAGLRIVNSLFTPAIVLIAARIRRRLRPQEAEWTLALSAVALAAMPVMFFFNALYYTDLGSVFYVLLSYLLLLEERPRLSGLAAIVAVAFRQTNIVWAAWVAGVDVVQQAGAMGILHRGPGPLNISTRAILARWPQFFSRIVYRLWLHILLGVAFVTFVIFNDGSLVVGDKSAHQTVIHGAQPFYCMAFIAAAVWPTLVVDSHALTCIASLPCMRQPVRVLPIAASIVAAAAAMAFSALDHPYLLADNRHYTFYIWQRFLSKEQIRMVLSPVFGLCPVLLWAILPGKLSHATNLLFFAAVTLVLVPAHLLEFRYFLIPFALVRVRMVSSSGLALLLEVLGYVVVNLAVFYLFLYHPFTWEGHEGQQRFMW